MTNTSQVLAITRKLTVAALIAIQAPTGVASEQSADLNLSIEVPAGPFQQWKQISFRIHGESDRTEEPNESDAASGIDVVVTSPSGSRLTIPAFQNLEDADQDVFECRFTPREAGAYTAAVQSAGKAGPTNHPVSFDVDKSTDGRGFLEVDRSQPYFLLFDNGDQFRGIGTNVGWEPRRRRNQEHTYDALFPTLAANGLNTVRTWMCPWNMPIEWNSPRLGDYDADALRRLDEMFALAEQHELYVVLVLGYHGELQTISGSFPNNDRWKENPYNIDNGGPCATPADFFTDPEAKSLYKKRLKELVARVACRSHLLAWEFWNEIDHIQRRGPVPGDAIVKWHEEMARYLRSIDVYNHPITTSISVRAPDGLWELDDIDLIMLHPYGATDRFNSLLTDTNKKYGKPAIAEEFSYSWKPAQQDEEDDFERELRLGLWRGLMSPTPVLPMTWWWEFHDARNDWRHFRPLAEFSSRMTEKHDPKWTAINLKTNNDSIECHGIKVGVNLFLWARNGNESIASDVTIDIDGAPTGGFVVRQFDTRTGVITKLKIGLLRSQAGRLTLMIPSIQGSSDKSFILSP